MLEMLARYKGEEVTIPLYWGTLSGKLWGVEGGHPIVCIHGYNDNASTWDPLLEKLSSDPSLRAMFLAVDLPGHGTSGHYTRAPSVLDYVSDLREVLRHYGWAKAAVLAHSFGCHTALYFCGLFPETASLLALLDFFPGVLISDGAAAVALVRDFLVVGGRKADKEQMKYSHEGALVRVKATRFSNISDPSASRLLSRSATKLGDVYFFHTDPRNKHAASPIITEGVHRAIIGSIRCPVRFACSSQTSALLDTPCAKASVEALRTLDDFKMVQYEGIHDTHMEQPNVLIDFLLEFFKPLKSKL